MTHGPLILWLSDPMDGPWAWFVHAARHGVAAGPADKADLADDAQHGLWVILPGQWARIHTVDLPNLRPRERLSAAGFAIEDKVGKGLADQHLALHEGDAEQRVGIIDQSKMDQVLASLKSAGLSPTRIYVDFDVCRPAGKAYCFDARVITCGPDGHAIDVSTYDALHPGTTVQAASVETLTTQIDPSSAVNFLQGAYGVQSNDFFNAQGLWRAAAAVGVLGLVTLGWQASLARAASKQAETLRAQTATLYQKATGKRPKGSPALAVTRALKSGQSGEVGFLQLSSILFGAVAQTEDVLLDRLTFDAAQARLSVRVMYPNFGAANALEKAVAANGGRFQAGAVRELDGQMVGDGIVTLGGVR